MIVWSLCRGLWRVDVIRFYTRHDIIIIKRRMKGKRGGGRPGKRLMDRMMDYGFGEKQ